MLRKINLVELNYLVLKYRDYSGLTSILRVRIFFKNWFNLEIFTDVKGERCARIHEKVYLFDYNLTYIQHILNTIPDTINLQKLLYEEEKEFLNPYTN